MCSSVDHFEDMVGHFKMTTNPKQEQPRQQSKPWTIDDEDLERNKAKVSNENNEIDRQTDRKINR